MSVRFTLDSAAVECANGTTVAAAMLNAGATRFRKSVHGEPRAPLCAMGVCHECRVTINGVAHQRSCLVEATDGMKVNTALAAPKSRSGGADTIAVKADVVIIGAGPAGVAAAVNAAEQGVSVVMLDEGNRAGGQIWRHRDRSSLNAESRQWIERLDKTTTRVFNGSTVSFVEQSSAGFLVIAEQGERRLEISTGKLILSTGARELFLPFSGSTLPGVMGVGALQALLKSGMDVRGKRIVIAGTGPLLMPVAAAASRAGARLLLVAEQAPLRSVMRFAAGLWRHPSALVQAAQYRAAFASASYKTGSWVSAARGSERVERVVVTDGVNEREMSCDILAAAHGLIPNTELPRHLGCATAGGAMLVDDVQAANVTGVYGAGEVTGVAGVELALVEGMIAGLAASGNRARAERHIPRARSLRQMAERMNSAFALRAELRGLAMSDAIVCRCEDVVMGAIQPGWTMRQAKLYTRAGMGACQGRTCSAALDFLVGASPDTVRLPVQPSRLTTLAAATAAVHNDPGERHDG